MKYHKTIYTAAQTAVLILHKLCLRFYQTRHELFPRFINVFSGQLKALRNSSKLLIAPITLWGENIKSLSLCNLLFLYLKASICFTCTEKTFLNVHISPNT